MHLDLVLDKPHALKLDYLTRQTQTEASAVLQQALDFYYQEIKRRQPNAADILRETGFIGSLDAEPDYSENYKQTLVEVLEKKHGYRR